MGASMMRMWDGRAAACGPPVVIAARGLWKAARAACPRSCTSSCARIRLLTEATRHHLSKVVPPVVVLALSLGRLVDAARPPSDRPRCHHDRWRHDIDAAGARGAILDQNLPHVCGRRSGNGDRIGAQSRPADYGVSGSIDRRYGWMTPAPNKKGCRDGLPSQAPLVSESSLGTPDRAPHNQRDFWP